MASKPTAMSLNLDALGELLIAADVTDELLTLDRMLSSCMSPACLELRLGFDISEGFGVLVSEELELCCM
jgi:hypothetical protein